MRRPDPYFITGLIAALAVGGFMLRPFATGSAPPEVTILQDSVLAGLAARSLAFQLGSRGAKIQIVEYFDYQCPACALSFMSHHDALRRAVAERTVGYNLVLLPLRRNANALAAAVYAMCLRQTTPEDSLFWRFHSYLLDNQDDLRASYPPDRWLNDALKSLEIANVRIADCLTEKGAALASDLLRESVRHEARGIPALPYFELNGKPASSDEVAAVLISQTWEQK